jgi:hypothetical protein
MGRVRLLVLLLLAFTGACGASRRDSAAGAVARPFALSSIGSSYGIQARLDGTVMSTDRWAYLTLPRGAVRTYQLDRQEYWDLRLRAAIATCRQRSFEISSEGRAVRLAEVLGLSREAATLDTTMRAFRDTLRLDVGIPPGVNLARSWIALIFEWPFANVMATYTMHTTAMLNGTAWQGSRPDLIGERCR